MIFCQDWWEKTGLIFLHSKKIMISFVFRNETPNFRRFSRSLLTFFMTSFDVFHDVFRRFSWHLSMFFMTSFDVFHDVFRRGSWWLSTFYLLTFFDVCRRVSWRLSTFFDIFWRFSRCLSTFFDVLSFAVCSPISDQLSHL